MFKKQEELEQRKIKRKNIKDNKIELALSAMSFPIEDDHNVDVDGPSKVLAGTDSVAGPASTKRPRLNSHISNKSIKSAKHAEQSPTEAVEANPSAEFQHPRRNLRQIINESVKDFERKQKKDEAKNKNDTIIEGMDKLNSNLKQKALKESFQKFKGESVAAQKGKTVELGKRLRPNAETSD